MQRTLMKYKLDMAEEAVSVQKQVIEAGTVYELHWHEYLEFEVVVSGEARHRYNNHTYRISSGDAYMMCYCDFHEVTALTDVTLYSLHFDSSLLSAELSGLLDYNRFRCHLETEELERILQLLYLVQKECEERRYGYRVLLKQYVREIVILMLRKSSVSSGSTAPMPIQQAVSYLNEHFTEQLSLGVLAQQLALSPNYLGQLFKQQMECSFREYLNLLRLKCACQLLQETDMSVKEVGYAAGYQSVEYFLNVFHKNMQMTPTQYRSRAKE